MEQKQTIAIFGATGSMGTAISKSLAKGQHRLLLLSNEAGKLKSLQSEIISIITGSDAEVIQSLNDTQAKADIFILAVPYSVEPEIASIIKPFSKGKIVISISNPVSKNLSGSIIKAGTSAAEELQKLLPHAKVVKAFNTTFAADFTEPVINGKRVDSFIAGNDDEAVKTVENLINGVGFNPIIAGNLSVSGTLENMQILLMQLTVKYEYNWHAGWKILHN